MKDEQIKYRLEHDSIGEKEVPENAYYGVQTLRAHENFSITGLKMHPELINSVAQIKKAAAITNFEVGELDKKRANAIVQACDEIIAGKLHDQFIVDPIQGGAGTSLNMNANEVIQTERLRFSVERRAIIRSSIRMIMSTSVSRRTMSSRPVERWQRSS